MHDDEHAARAADRLSARAFAIGNDIAFARGEFSPHEFEGQKLIAHELAHGMQRAAVPRKSASTVRKRIPADAGTNASFMPGTSQGAGTPNVCYADQGFCIDIAADRPQSGSLRTDSASASASAGAAKCSCSRGESLSRDEAFCLYTLERLQDTSLDSCTA